MVEFPSFFQHVVSTGVSVTALNSVPPFLFGDRVVYFLELVLGLRINRPGACSSPADR